MQTATITGLVMIEGTVHDLQRRLSFFGHLCVYWGYISLGGTGENVPHPTPFIHT